MRRALTQKASVASVHFALVKLAAVLALMVVWGVGAAQAAPLGYTLDVTAFYQFGGSPDAGPSGSPDTSEVTFTNNGTTTFSGNLILDGTSPGQGHLNTTLAVTLTPGQSKTLSLSNEASNQGGWNKVTGQPDNGIQVELVGLINGSESVNLSVFDKDIHSGVPRSANGTLSDSYVLQGGDPFGGDTGDAFETTQANGHFEFFEAGGGTAVPEPATLMLLGPGLVGISGFAWRRRHIK
jgi:PEP-CTERM motif-containing protein